MDNQSEQEKRRANRKEWREKNREKIREYSRIYREKNRQRTREYDNQYRLTPKRCKYNTIYQWRYKYGINFHCCDTLYEIYESTTTCNFCGCKFASNNLKCVDHDHSITDGSDNVRAILCSRCNVRDVLALVDLPKGQGHQTSDAKTKTTNSQ